MTRHRLDNARWGFESNCFVCEPSNQVGLRIPFFHDDEADVVEAEFRLGPAFSGAPTYVHGGLVLAILDEAMAWAAIAVAGAMAVTRSTNAAFLRPVRVDRDYRVVARVEEKTPEGHLALAAEVAPVSGGDPCTRANAEFVALSAEQAAAALGQEATGDDAGFVKGLDAGS